MILYIEARSSLLKVGYCLVNTFIGTAYQTVNGITANETQAYAQLLRSLSYYPISRGPSHSHNRMYET
jgi:hypothetical protein